jgi:hypothetical protein
MQYQYKVDDMPLPDLRLRFVTEFEHYLLTEDMKGLRDKLFGTNPINEENKETG